MSDTASKAKMNALAAYFRNGGRAGMNVAPFDPQDQNDYSGRLSAASRVGPNPTMDVPAYGMHHVSAPEDSEIGGVGTFDQMEKERAQRLQLNNLAAQPPAPEPDLSGYRDFSRLKQQLAPQPTINKAAIQQMTQQGAQEVTPELEAKLFGKPQPDEEEE